MHSNVFFINYEADAEGTRQSRPACGRESVPLITLNEASVDTGMLWK